MDTSKIILQKQLEHLLERKKKADALPPVEKKKWKAEIDKLNNQIAAIQKQLGINVFDEANAIMLFNDALKELTTICHFGDDTQNFWRMYPEHDAATSEAELKINTAFKNEDMLAFKEAVTEFKQAWINAYEAYKNSQKMHQIGFFEVEEAI